jgi:hypothetical protein
VVRAWIKLIWNSLGAAAIAAAAQLAIAQALGIIRWDASFPVDDPSGWNALLTWIAFIFAVAVLGGAAVGRRALRRPTKPDAMPARIAAALSAGLGAGIAVALAWLPAKAARPPVSVHPELLVAMTAATAIVAGIAIAVLALSVPPVAVGVRAAVAWIWLVGIGSAIAGYLTHRPYAAPRLAVLDAPSLISVAWWSGPYLMIALAALLGIGVAAVARWAEAGRFGIAISGFAGPAVVAAAYLMTSPGEGSRQVDPYRAALFAVGAGLVASVIVALPGSRHPAGRATAKASRGYEGSGGYEGYSGYEGYGGYESGSPVIAASPSEPRQPLLDETYEPEMYPQEPTSAHGPDDRGEGADEPRYGEPQYGEPQYSEPRYGDPQYGEHQYSEHQHDESQHREPQHPMPAQAVVVKPSDLAARGVREFTDVAGPSARESTDVAAPGARESSDVAGRGVKESPRPAAVMGQPPARSYEEDYSEWLRDLGHVPGQRANTDREDQRL